MKKDFIGPERWADFAEWAKGMSEKSSSFSITVYATGRQLDNGDYVLEVSYNP